MPHIYTEDMSRSGEHVINDVKIWSVKAGALVFEVLHEPVRMASRPSSHVTSPTRTSATKWEATNSEATKCKATRIVIHITITEVRPRSSSVQCYRLLVAVVWDRFRLEVDVVMESFGHIRWRLNRLLLSSVISMRAEYP